MWANIISTIAMICTILGGVWAYLKFKKLFNQTNTIYISNLKIEEANHRQKWVDDFRCDLANYFNLVSLILREENIKKESIEKLGCMHNSIMLRLNPNDENDKKLEIREKIFYRNIMMTYYNLNNLEGKYQNNELIDNEEIVYDKIKNSNEYKKYKIAKKEYDSCYDYSKDHNCEIQEKYHGSLIEQNRLENARNGLMPIIINCLREEGGMLLNDFRLYLKSEWERIKCLINNTSATQYK